MIHFTLFIYGDATACTRHFQQWGVIAHLAQKGPTLLCACLIYGLDLSGSFYICPIFVHLLQTDMNPPHHWGSGILRPCFQSWNGKLRAKPGSQLLHFHVLWLQGISFSVSQQLLKGFDVYDWRPYDRVKCVEAWIVRPVQIGRDNAYQCCFMQCAEFSSC